MQPKQSKVGVEQEKTILRAQLDNLSALIKKLGNVFLQIESEKRISIIEPQMIHRLLGLAGKLQSMESLEGDEGEVFVLFLKVMADTIQNIGILQQWQKEGGNKEELTKVLTLLRGLESQTKDLLTTVITIDEKRRKTNYETFGGLLQKLVDTIQEKRHLILRNVT